MHKLKLPFPHKMALPQAGQFSRVVLTGVHLLLLTGILMPFPLLGIILVIMPACIFLAVEWQRKNPYAQDALRFAFQRVILFLLLALAGMYIVQHTALSAQIAWRSIVIIFAPLCIYDAILCWRGIPGMLYIPKREKKA